MIVDHDSKFDLDSEHILLKYKYYNRLTLYKQLKNNKLLYTFNRKAGYKIGNKFTHMCCFVNYESRLYNPLLSGRL
jgi:hypothetical protein